MLVDPPIMLWEAKNKDVIETFCANVSTDADTDALAFVHSSERALTSAKCGYILSL
jgi:hypothetical protein